jgi:hypothetical protein
MTSLKTLFENTGNTRIIGMDSFSFHIINERIDYIEFDNVFFKFHHKGEDNYYYYSADLKSALHVHMKQLSDSPLTHLKISYIKDTIYQHYYNYSI